MQAVLENLMFFAVMIGFFGGMIALIKFTYGFGAVKHYKQVPGSEDLMFKGVKDEKNPWIEKIYKNGCYGKVPKNIVELMDRVSPDKGEKVISSMWVSNGWMHWGYLIITTKYVRWVETFPAKDDSFWQHSSRMEKISAGVIHIEDYLFQSRSSEWNFFNSQLTQFVKLHQIVQQSLLH